MKYHNYTQDSLKEALAAVEKGLSLRSASEKFKVPFSTIRCKHKGIYALGKRSGPTAVFTDEEEQVLVDWIVSVNKRGFPLTKNMFLDNIQLFVKELKKNNPFTEGRPGRGYMLSFIKRHPELTLTIPPPPTQKQPKVSEDVLRGWFRDVEEYLKENNLLDIDPSRIFNCSEIAFFLDPKGYKILVDRKYKLLYNLDADGRECLVAMLTGNLVNFTNPIVQCMT